MEGQTFYAAFYAACSRCRAGKILCSGALHGKWAVYAGCQMDGASGKKNGLLAWLCAMAVMLFFPGGTLAGGFFADGHPEPGQIAAVGQNQGSAVGFCGAFRYGAEGEATCADSVPLVYAVGHVAHGRAGVGAVSRGARGAGRSFGMTVNEGMLGERSFGALDALRPPVAHAVSPGRSVSKAVPGSVGRKFWTNSTEFNGTKVFQRNDLIDPKFVDARGRTNLQRMQKGLAPIDPDGKSLNLHHMTQGNNSLLAELTATFHQQNSKVIHINLNTVPSGIDRKAFDSFCRDYWENRANDFSQ